MYLVVADLAHLPLPKKGGWRIDGKLGSRWAGWLVLLGGLLLGADPITPFGVEIGIL